MEKSYKNNEEKFAGLIHLLKSLPAENAPQDFELRLYAKIENQNFESVTGENRTFNFPFWLLAPVTTAAVTIVVLLLVFNNANNLNTYNNNVASINNQQAKLVIKTDKTIIQPKRNYRIIVNKNDVVVTEKINLPFNPAKSLKIDGYLSNRNRLYKNSTIKGPKNFVSQRQTYFEFPGFIPVDENPQILNKLKAQIDSLQKENLKNRAKK